MIEFLKTAEGMASAVMTLIAFVSLVLYKPVIKPRIDRRKAEKAAEQKFRKDVLDKIDRLEQSMNLRFKRLDEDIGDLQYERLSQAHDFYVGRGWCPGSKKLQLCNMYRSYSEKGRNHLSAHYEQEILDLADGPRDE